jgi:hypothetical protein
LQSEKDPMPQANASMARELLGYLAAKPGTVSVMTRRENGERKLVVKLAPGVRLPKEKRPEQFKGVDVVYEDREPAEALMH